MIIYLFVLLLFMPSIQTQICQIDHCMICPILNECQKCEPEFGLDYFIDDLCRHCWIENCFDCSLNIGKCQYCKLGYGLQLIDNWDVCSECRPLDNCVQCSGSNVFRCGLCAKFYGLDLNGQCRPCLDPKCQSCQNDFRICTLCKLYFGLNSSNACIPCKQNCSNCSINAQNCTTCIGGYYVNSPDTCRKCFVLNCARCSSDLSVCNYCGGFYGVSQLNTCQPCSLSNCQICYAKISWCHLCKRGFGVSKFINVDYGIICDPCDDFKCVSCSRNSSNCTECSPPYFPENSLCAQCKENCAKCTNRSMCHECIDNDNYLWKGSCSKCPSVCTECQYDGTGYTCFSCIQGFHLQLVNNTYRYCVQICGDEISITFPCDNKIGVEYDGCTDDCKVMQDFTCQVINKKSVCSYLKQIEMEMVYFDSMVDYNMFHVVLKVFPPLYVFSQSLSKQIFKTENSEFQIESIKYDKESSEFNIALKFIAKFEQLEIKIIFSPSEKVNEEFFATPESMASITLKKPILFIDYVFLINILFYVCFAICVLTLISFVLGIMLKRLEGLQAMMTIQFCWITIIWTDNIFILPFGSFLPLKYSIGYSLQKISTKSTVVTSPLFLSELKMKPQLSINFGISICVCFLLLIFAIIAFAIFKKASLAESQRKKRKEQNENDEKNNFQMKQSIYEFSMQILLQFILFSLCYFIFCSVIYFRNSNFDTISIVIFSLFIVIMTLVSIVFYFFPDPFSYFRYSFQPKPLSMNHQFFHIFVISLSLLLVLFLFSYEYLAFILLGLMILFTLITTPYKQTVSNYRSVFNYLVMSSFVAFKIYLSKINLDRLWQKNTYYYLFGESLLLLIVTILGFVCQIVFKVLEKRGNKKLLQDKEIQNLILEGLVETEVRKKMGAVSHNSILKDFVSPNMKLLTLSNHLSRQKSKGTFKDNEGSFDDQGKHKRMLDPILHDNLNWQTNFQMEQIGKTDRKYARNEKKRKQSLIENVLQNENSFVQFKAVLEKTVSAQNDCTDVRKSEEQHYLQIYQKM